MKMPPTSVWLTAIMAIYATALFAYKFFVEGVGLSLRNVLLAVATYALVAAVWFVNRLSERRRRDDKSRDR